MAPELLPSLNHDTLNGRLVSNQLVLEIAHLVYPRKSSPNNSHNPRLIFEDLQC